MFDDRESVLNSRFCEDLDSERSTKSVRRLYANHIELKFHAVNGFNPHSISSPDSTRSPLGESLK